MSSKRNFNVTTQSKSGSNNRAATHSRGKKKPKNSFRETSEAIIIALIAAMLLRAFVVQAFRIPTGSMKDTLLVGDFLLVNKFIYGVRTPDRIPVINAKIPFIRLPSFKSPQNGDVVVFKYPKDESLDYIKRCIALGGQTLEIRKGHVFIDGKPEGKRTELGRAYDADEGKHIQYSKIETANGKNYTIRHYVDQRLENLGPIEVPEGSYFMMGDNRDNSSDSRVWGFLPAENIVGEALIIYFSWDKNSEFWNLLDSVRWSRIANLIR
jgi:signal peptidase I